MEVALVSSPQDFEHQAVMADEVVAAMPAHAQQLVDCTLGGGGHARALLQQNPNAHLTGFDRDLEAQDAARTHMGELRERATFVHAPFSEIADHIQPQSVDFLLADLGVSSHQLDTAARGFSFRMDAPLDMRMDPTSGISAAQWIEQHSSNELARVLRDYGEERFAGRLALAIHNDQPQTTGELAAIVRRIIPKGKQNIDPATRTFQALRIAVNDELGELDKLLAAIPHVLAPKGRAAIITFHSLEDRRVKQAYRNLAVPPAISRHQPDPGPVHLDFRLVNRKPLTASAQEVNANPRARSAKLRVIERKEASDAS